MKPELTEHQSRALEGAVIGRWGSPREIFRKGTRIPDITAARLHRMGRLEYRLANDSAGYHEHQYMRASPYSPPGAKPIGPNFYAAYLRGRRAWADHGHERINPYRMQPGSAEFARMWLRGWKDSRAGRIIAYRDGRVK